MWSQPCTLARPAPWQGLHLGKGRGPGSRNQPVVQAEREQEHATDQVEIGVRGPEREVLLGAHGDAGAHPDQQNHNAAAHHQRCNHWSFLVLPGGLKSHSGEPGLTHRPRLCDLMSGRGLAYLILGIGTLERFNALLR